METKILEMHILDLVAGKVGRPSGNLHPEINFSEDLNSDSVQIVEIVIAVEHRFHIVISDEEAGKLCTIADLYVLVHKKLEA